MYIPHYFKNADTGEVEAFIRENGFGILINVVEGKPFGTHIPLELSDDKTKLLGHVSRANPQSRYFKTDADVLTIFSGPHTYVSASWYNHENVSTWNYIAVHVYGRIRIIEGVELYDSLKHLLDKYEAHSEKPVAMEKFSPGYVEASMKGVVGFEIMITDIQASYKLSQNRDEESFRNVVHELEKRSDENSHQVAQAMKKNREKKKS